MSDASVRPRAAPLVAFALPLAAFALVAPQIVAQDLPWWDEATYLGLGRGLVAGAPPDFAWSPAYALTLGIARAALGPARAVAVVHLAWAAVFAAAVGLSARTLLRDLRPALALAAAALGSSHALVVVGPQRAAISLVLLAFAVLASRRRPRAGLATGAVLAIAAAACRLEAAFAIPFLLPAAWAASPAAAPRRAARIVWATVFSAAALAITLGTAAADKRAWFAFGQHYAFATYERDPASFRPGFVPGLDYRDLMRRDFPGATSVVSAALVAPVRFGAHVARNAATAVEVAAAALMPERLAAWKGALAVAVLALAVAATWARRREPLPRGLGWLVLSLAATSSGAILVVPQGRHVFGLSLAILFVLAAAAWAAAPKTAPFLALAGLLTLASAQTLARTHPRPQAVRRLVARAMALPRPIVVAGAGSSCFCAYLDACDAHEDPSAGGKGEHDRDCAAVALAPDYFTSSMAPSRPLCVTSAYDRVAVNPEVWERR